MKVFYCALLLLGSLSSFSRAEVHALYMEKGEKNLCALKDLNLKTQKNILLTQFKRNGCPDRLIWSSEKNFIYTIWGNTLVAQSLDGKLESELELPNFKGSEFYTSYIKAWWNEKSGRVNVAIMESISDTLVKEKKN